MASSIRPASNLFKPAQFLYFRPSPSSSPLPRCRYQPFSHTARTNAARRMGAQTLKPKIPSQMSNKNSMKKALEMHPELIPDDVGLLDSTFIRPVWKNFPSFFNQPRAFIRMAWLSVKFPVQNFIGLVVYCRKFNKIPLALWSRKRIARDLHKKMYTAFAEGDKAAISELCCQGLAETFNKRIMKRPRDSPKLTWTLHKYIRFPYSPTLTGARVISDRGSAFQEGKGLGLRQVVVRIRSKQSLSKNPPNTAASTEGQGDAPKPIVQDCTEYVVIQRFMINGVQGDWKVWGLAEETSLEDIRSTPLFSGDVTLKQKMDALKSEKIRS